MPTRLSFPLPPTRVIRFPVERRGMDLRSWLRMKHAQAVERGPGCRRRAGRFRSALAHLARGSIAGAVCAVAVHDRAIARVLAADAIARRAGMRRGRQAA